MNKWFEDQVKNLMTGFNVVLRIWRDLPMLIWEPAIFLESLGADSPLTWCGSSIGRTKRRRLTLNQIVNPNVRVPRARFPASGGLLLACLCIRAKAASVEQEIRGGRSRYLLNPNNWSFLVLWVWSLLFSVLNTPTRPCLNGIV